MPSHPEWRTSAAALPADPGAYALAITVRRPVALPARCAEATLAPGGYVYVGSARGPGGIGARCRRHITPDKAVRWHVDRLTAGARPGDVKAAAFVDGDECALARRLLGRPDLFTPIVGFGNTDCRTCPAHLFRIDPAAPPGAILDTLAALPA